MIERASEFGASAAVPLVGADTTEELTAGDMLRHAREAHGLDIAVVAAALKVPPQKIEALEADDIDALPDPVFARALAASMSRALRLDPGPVLARLPGAPLRGFGPTQRPLGASFNTDLHRANGSPLSRTLWTVVALLLVGAAAVVFLPQTVFDRASASLAGLMPHGDAGSAEQQAAPAATGAPANLAAAPAAPAVEPASPAASAGAASAAAGGTTSATGAGTGAAGTMSAGTGSSAAPLVSGARPPQDSAAGASAAAKPEASNDLLAFNAREDAWISVTDGSGKQLLRRMVKAGENVPLNGTPPLSVVVGRASAVEVLVHGKPLDISTGAGSGGVARFEVKP